MEMHGEEQFLLHGKTVGLNVYDFWRFAYSDLNADPRDDVAEYLVAHALGIENPINKENWEFYIVPTSKINAACNDNKTISLSRIKNLGFKACGYEEIKSQIDVELDEIDKYINCP